MSDTDQGGNAPAEGKKRRTRRERQNPSGHVIQYRPARPGALGGRYSPLNPADLPRIDQAVRHILSRIGLSEAPDFVVERVTAAGGALGNDGRLTFSESLIEAALAGLPRNFSFHGRDPEHDMLLSGKRVYTGTGGAAPSILDIETRRYRDSTLQDLYDAARVIDRLQHVHFFSRPLVARDMPDLRSLDINTTYACLAGTSKHVFVGVSAPEHVEEIAQMCFAVAGSPEAFAEKPFLSFNINHSVPPLRFDENSCGVMLEAARLGIPIHSNTFGQLGASSSVLIASSVAQTIAETLAGMIFSWLVNPEAKVIFGTRPMITDLRTGGMSGGSGEQAILSAAAIQMAHYYDLPNSTIAGATDSKLDDAQAGYEKCLTVSLAAQTGCNLITQACGMHASLMGVALESYLIDNDMLGSIIRSLTEIEVTDEALGVTAIDEVVHGEGHFLGRSETFDRMQSDFLYPEIGDRRTFPEWEADGSKDIREVAIDKTKQILASYHPGHLVPDLDHTLRAEFDIRLPESLMGKN